jgi:protein SDA1
MSSLPLLQSQIRRDPAGYEQDYRIQFRSFETTAQTFHVTPGRPHKLFQELVSFLAHVFPCYPNLAKELDFPSVLFGILRREPERIHPCVRRVMVSAILSLLRRGVLSLMTVLTECARLFALEDKELRTLLHGRLLVEISTGTSGVNKHRKNTNGSQKQKMFVPHVPPHELKLRVQEFLMKQINATKSVSELETRAMASLVCGLYKRRDWTDDFTVNSMMVALCRSEDPKVASAAMHVFLGESTFAAALLELLPSEHSKKKKNPAEESDGEEDGSKRSKKSKTPTDSVCDFTAIDSIVEPYGFAESLLKRATDTGSKQQTTFEFRLLALRVVARLVYRRELVLPNLYPFLEKYLYPSNRHVTKVLACLAQASHPQVPPEEMASVVRHVLDNFVSDHCRPEVITVGLNALRGVCERAPLCLTKDQLMDIVHYRFLKTSKSVMGAAKAILNLYRDTYPELLHRNVRGKEASMAVQRGETKHVPQFGEFSVSADVDGIDLLVAAKKRKRVEEEEEEEEEGDEEEEEEEEECDEEGEEDDDEDEFDEDEDEDDEEDSSDIASDESDDDSSTNLPYTADHVLDNSDFRKIKKLKSIAADGGSVDEEELDESSVESEAEDDWILDPTRMGSIRPDDRKSKDSGLAAAERKLNMKIKSETRRGGLTNKEKRRNKPLMMSVQKQHKKQRGMSAAQKFRQVKSHIANLQKQVGPQKRRRTGNFSRK